MSCRNRRPFLAVLLLTSFTSLGFAQDNGSSQSLADVARKLRKDNTNEVRMTDADTKKLFEAVDRIFAFAAEDSGMPKHAPVKRRLVSKLSSIRCYTQNWKSGPRPEKTCHTNRAPVSLRGISAD